MDIVYPLLRDKQNIELMFSLRSLCNFEHDKVWIVGNLPKWITNVNHINYTDSGDRYTNVRNKYKLICEHPGISDDFVLMHDDMYILNKIDTIPYYHTNILRKLENIKLKYGENKYYKIMQSTLLMFDDAKDYDTHTPIILNKKKFKYVMDNYGDSECSKRNIYCNLNKVKSETIVSKDYSGYGIHDCKCYNIDELDVLPNQLFLSSDNKIIGEEYIEFMSNLFDTPSKYEDLSFKYVLMEKVKVLFLKSLYPYKKGEEGFMKTANALMREKKGGVKILQQGNSKKVEKQKDKVVGRNTSNKGIESQQEAKTQDSEEQKVDEVDVTTSEETNLPNLRKQYKEVYGKKVPNNKKNDAERIEKKIEEKYA